MNDNLKYLNLTEQDFKMLVDGLDALPDKDVARNIMQTLMEIMITNKNPDKIFEKFDRKMEKSPEKILQREDIKILQGKLLLLKRYLIETNALNEAQNIADHIR